MPPPAAAADGGHRQHRPSTSVTPPPSGRKVPRRTLLRSAAVACGIQFGWALQLSLLTPYVQELGIPHAFASLVWLCGPLSGLVVQPLVGHLSDRVRLDAPLGRRRPFIAGGAAAIATAVLIVGFSADLGRLLGDSKVVGAARPRAVVVYVIGFWLLDVGNNATQGPCRALLADLTGKDHRRTRIANAYFSLFMALGNILGFATGSYGGWYKVFPFTMTSACTVNCANLKSAFILDIIVLGITTFITVASVDESAYVNPEESSANETQEAFMWELFGSFRYFTLPVWMVLIVTALTWIGWFPFILFDTDWFGREVYHGDPDNGLIYHDGVGMGSFGLMLNSVVLGFTSVGLETLCRKWGSGLVWGVSNIIMCFCFSAMLVIACVRPPASVSSVLSSPFIPLHFRFLTAISSHLISSHIRPDAPPERASTTRSQSEMGASATVSMQIAAARPCISSSARVSSSKMVSLAKASFYGSYHANSSTKSISSSAPVTRSTGKLIIRAMSQDAASAGSYGLPIDLRGKRAFIAGIADDNGYGWAIAKALAAAGAEILVGTWVPALNIFETSLKRGKFDESRKLPNGSLMEISKVYPLDAVFDSPEDVPEDIKTNKRYAGSSNWTVKEVAELVKNDFGTIDILVHSLANGPEVSKPLLETSRKGYLAAISASSYSFVSLLQHFLPIMNPGGATLSLTYIASERTIPGYGGGMSSAKAALESDTRVLAFEAGRKGGIRVNTISAGPLGSRAAKAIGFIEKMIDYSYANAPVQKELSADEVGNAAAFLVSPLASAVTGSVVYVDNGLHTMGLAVDSPALGL